MTFPVVELQRPDGTSRRFVNPTTLDTGHYPQGRRATVLVDPTDPDRAELASSERDRGMLQGLLAVVGVALAGLGVLMVAGVVLVARLLG